MVRLVAASLLLGTSVFLPAQQPPVVRGGATAVIVDVVVRDNKGKPVTGLTRSDFELYEDNVRQDIADFTVGGMADEQGQRGVAMPTPASPPSSAGVNTEAPRFTALVFDRLTPEGRAAAYKGALAAVDAMRDGDYAAVYVADLSLITVQNYTNDREKVRAAVNDVATRATSVFDRTAMRDISKTDSAPDDHASTPWVAGAESAGRPVDPRGVTDRIPSGIGTATNTFWERLARDQQGYATTNALLAIVSGLGTVPGRKTAVFFAEGLAIPDAILSRFRNVVAVANRANVSIYTIDAAGLRAHSKDQETYREINGMGNAGLKINPDGSSQSNLGMLERNEDVLRKDPRTSLTLLAGQTGGFLIDNMNDLAKGFARIEADRRFYYLLTYAPKNTNFDNAWRTITVEVPKRRVTVRARTGYLASRRP
jgi:VWFA-related protein